MLIVCSIKHVDDLFRHIQGMISQVYFPQQGKDM